MNESNAPDPQPDSSVEVDTVDVGPSTGAKAREPSGPPAPLLPLDVWTMNSIVNKLEVTIDKEARSRSRPRRYDTTRYVKAAASSSNDRSPEGGARLVQSASSASIGAEVAQPPAEDSMNSSASSHNSTMETFLKSLAAGDQRKEERLRACLKPVDLDEDIESVVERDASSDATFAQEPERPPADLHVIVLD